MQNIYIYLSIYLILSHLIYLSISLSISLFFYFLVCVYSIHDYMTWSAKMSRWAEPGSSSAMWWVFSPISSGWCILEGPGWWGLRADAFSPELGSLTSQDLGVSINGGTPKWIASKWKILSKWMIYGYPLFRKHPFYFYTFEPSNRDERRDLSKNGFGLENWGPKGAFVIELGRHVWCSELGSAPLCGPGSNMKP